MNPFEKYLSKEDKLQREVIRYSILKYSKRPIPCNTEGRKTTFERFKSVQMGVVKGTLDLFFPYPNKKFNGLFLELKKDGEELYFKRKPTVLKTDHLKEQQKTINKHLKNGYYACFSIGIDEAIKNLDDYFNNKL